MSAFILLHASAQKHNQMLEDIDRKKKKKHHRKPRSGDTELTHSGRTRSSRHSGEVVHTSSHKSSRSRHTTEIQSSQKPDNFDSRLTKTLSSKETTRTKMTSRFGFSKGEKKQECKSLLLLHETQLEELRRTHKQVGKEEVKEETDALLLSDDENPLTQTYSNNSSIFSTRDLLNRELMITTSIDLKRDSLNSLVVK